ncbi:aminoglycoside phosphotransferase family protein [Streptomyces sp. NPDC050504]|uniref:aminoglycoside phosphotransferase family protein n=1 Tax=Streptomyces sp. NPDC050504 TaxID=3365618 RepID=UPI00379E256A
MTDTAIDGALVRALLHEQHPDLAGLDLREVAGGWDNRLWRLGDDLAVRMPRTERAPALLRKEFRWLPALAPRLPLPVPTPVRIGEPSALFPGTWTVAVWVPGEPADRAPVTRGEHAADALAGFLGALHRAAPDGAPANPDRGVPLRAFADGPGRQSELLEGTGLAAGARKTWADAVAAPEWHGPSLWLHGDLHPANAVTADGTLAGVLDFGELCAGDPATDLSAAWLLLPAGAADRFFAGYAAATGAAVDPATVRRARGWAVLRALGLIGIGLAGERGLPGGKVTWGPAGRAALERALADRSAGGA